MYKIEIKIRYIKPRVRHKETNATTGRVRVRRREREPLYVRKSEDDTGQFSCWGLIKDILYCLWILWAFHGIMFDILDVLYPFYLDTSGVSAHPEIREMRCDGDSSERTIPDFRTFSAMFKISTRKDRLNVKIKKLEIGRASCRERV